MSIFDRFYQTRKENNAINPGSGLGLAYIKHLVEVHKGEINIESEFHKGTTCTVTIPISKTAYSDNSIIELQPQKYDFKYTKIDARITKSYLIKGLGKLGFQLEGGTTIGDAPSSLLHYQRGMRTTGFSLYIENAFNTMRPNEFLSQHYFSAHIHHRFGALFRSEYSAPEISILTSAGWGSLDHPEQHQGLNYSTMEKGYYESGILIDHLLILNTSGIGVGAFYRYGPYQLSNIRDNFGFSFTMLYVIQ